MEEDNTPFPPTPPVVVTTPMPEPTRLAGRTPAKSKNSLIVILSVLLLIAVSIAGLLALQTQRLAKQLTQYQTATPSPTATPATENEVFGIQINTCCSCPTKIDKSLIGTDGWVLYEEGKNYSSLLPDECKGADCAPCPPLKETSAKAKECYAKTQCDSPEGTELSCANPAAVFCTCMGGELEIRENDQGQYGLCKIDGSEYDEWDYYRSWFPPD